MTAGVWSIIGKSMEYLILAAGLSSGLPPKGYSRNRKAVVRMAEITKGTDENWPRIVSGLEGKQRRDNSE